MVFRHKDIFLIFVNNVVDNFDNIGDNIVDNPDCLQRFPFVKLVLKICFFLSFCSKFRRYGKNISDNRRSG